MTLSPYERKSIALARLALLGEPTDDEPPERAEKRERYRQMLDDAGAEITEGQRLPYKDDDG